ncbi:MAG: hypothetical protein WA880_09220 [Ornithinimicrobium sp.]
MDYPLPWLQAGTTGTVCGPLGLRVPFTVDAVDEQGKTWAWTVRLRVRDHDIVTLALAHGVQEHGVEEHRVEEQAKGCATWLTLDGAWPVVQGYAPIARYALGRLVR